jgi:hypothetical protein
MGTLKEDINKQASWIVKAFEADKLFLDYSIKSFIEIDKFFIVNSDEGKAKRGARLESNLGIILFSLAAYIGNTIILNVPGSAWETDDDTEDGELNIAIKFPDGGVVWPNQRVMKRFKNGLEDSIYVYGHALTKDWTNEKFDDQYWMQTKKKRPWWKFSK